MEELYRHKLLFRGKKRLAVAKRCMGLAAAAGLAAALVLMAAAGYPGDPGDRRYFLEPTLRLPVDTVCTYLVTVEDSIPNDTLFQLRSLEGFPVAYYRKINTNVCFDGKCRMLKVSLYWNITGRYLGLELPPEEFLSKSDHEPFSRSEYDRMNRLLADSLSPLADYDFEELAPPVDDLLSFSETNAGGSLAVDAVTSATSPAMADYVVQGAAYTTYRLWHFVYGPTQDAVIRLTGESLDPGLLEKILESQNRSDVAWALQRVQADSSLNPGLQRAITGFIKDEDHSLASMAIAAISPSDLSSASLQRVLLEKLPGLNYSLKNQIVDKLKEAPGLDEEVKMSLARGLASAEGAFLTHVLELFTWQNATGDEVCRLLSGLLQDENDFIARKIFAYLEKAGSTDEIVLERMSRYKQQSR